MEIESRQAAGLVSSQARRANASGGSEFAKSVTKMIEDVNRDQVEAAKKIKDLAVGGNGSIHAAMVAISNAEGSFRLMMEIRNRLVQGVNQLLQTGR